MSSTFNDENVLKMQNIQIGNLYGNQQDKLLQKQEGKSKKRRPEEFIENQVEEDELVKLHTFDFLGDPDENFFIK